MCYRIVKTKKGQFQVVLLGKNGKVLSTSELFKRKDSAWNNISSQIENGVKPDGDEETEPHPLAIVQDDTVDVPEKWEVDMYGIRQRVWGKAKPKYFPGINPQKKKRPLRNV